MKLETTDPKPPVNVNAVVDPSAALTDASDEGFVPQSSQELATAIQALIQNSRLTPGEAYIAVKKTFGKSEESMSKVEESIRKQVREILNSLVVEARPKTGIKWGQKVKSDYKPGHPEWEKAVGELRATLGKMQADDSSAEEKKNIMGVFTIDDIRKIFEAEGLEVPSVGGVKKIEVDAMERAKNIRPAVEKAQTSPDAFEQFAATLDAPFTSLMPDEVESAFYILALDRAKISDDEKDAIQASLTEEDSSEEGRKLHLDRMKKIAASPAFEEVLEKRLEDIAELSIENLAQHEQWDIINDDDAREEYVRKQIKMARNALIEKLSGMLSSAHTKEASGVPEASWRKFSKALDEVATEFLEFYES